MFGLSEARSAVVVGRLESDLIAWLTTVSPAGKPHTVPVWFQWDGETILIFSEPETRKVRDLRANPAAAFALETRDEGEEVIFFEGTIELTAEPTSAFMSDAYRAKYAHLFPRIDSSPEKMTATYTQPLRFVPTRVKAWGIAE